MIGRSTAIGVAACLGALAMGAVIQGQTLDSASYIRLLYRKYLNKEPTPTEAAYWAGRMLRDVSSTDFQAIVIGSDEYLSRFRGDLTSWLNTVHSEVLNRNPRPDELEYWLGQLRRLGNDRVAWAKEFLRSEGSLPPSISSPSAGVAASDLPGRLVTTSQLLVQSVQREIPGVRGWLVRVQANNLNSAAESNLEVLRFPQRNVSAARQALQTLTLAVQGIQNGLAQAGYSATSSRLYANQAAELLSAIGRSASYSPSPTGGTGTPTIPTSTGTSTSGLNQESYSGFSRMIADLAWDSQQMIYLLRGVFDRDYYHEQLMRSAESFAADVDLFRARLRIGYALVNVRSDALSLRQQANNFSAQLQRGEPDGRVVQQWSQTVATLNLLLDAAAIREADRVRPGKTSPQGGGVPVTLTASPALLDAVDRSIAQCDALAVGFAPFVFYSPNVPQLQAEVRNLRNSLTDFRSRAISGASRGELTARLSQCTQDLLRVDDAWKRATSRLQGIVAPDLAALSAAVQELNQKFAFGS